MRSSTGVPPSHQAGEALKQANELVSGACTDLAESELTPHPRSGWVQAYQGLRDTDEHFRWSEAV